MRHPPSAGCLFGQTGCLTAQAVDGILMYMTNDSLSPLSLSPDSFQLHSVLSLLLLPFLPCEISGFKMHDSVATTAAAVRRTCILRYLGQSE